MADINYCGRISCAWNMNEKCTRLNVSISSDGRCLDRESHLE